MEEIKKVLVAGRGAVGGLFGSLIEQKIGSDFAFLCDEKRKQKYDTLAVITKHLSMPLPINCSHCRMTLLSIQGTAHPPQSGLKNERILIFSMSA